MEQMLLIKQTELHECTGCIKELEKIEMVSGYDNVYRLDYAVIVMQKTILSAFGISEDYVKQETERISMKLKEAV